MGLVGRTAIVTGASEGIGFAIAESLVAAGASVVVTGRREHALVDATKKLGPASSYVVGDVAEAGTAERTLEYALQVAGGVDLLVCNAGVLIPGVVTQQPLAEVDQVIGINLRGTIASLSAIAPVLAAGQDPAVVVITSSIGRRPAPGFGIYGATKAALHYLIPTWAAELSRFNIRVNGVCAGVTITPGLRGVAETMVGLEKAAVGGNLIKRMATPEEVARPVLTLLDASASAYVTGSIWDIDGGYLLDLGGGSHGDNAADAEVKERVSR